MCEMLRSLFFFKVNTEHLSLEHLCLFLLVSENLNLLFLRFSFPVPHLQALLRITSKLASEQCMQIACSNLVVFFLFSHDLFMCLIASWKRGS